MVNKKLPSEQVESYVEELLNGKGYFVIPQLFSSEEIQQARDIIHFYSNQTSNKVTHFQGKNEDKIQLQRRVWNLLNKGDIFVQMVQHLALMQIGCAFLGDEFCLGSIAANRLLPGGPGQEAHIDYPYWDMYKRSSFPINLTPTFPLNLQVSIMLDDFTVENGPPLYGQELNKSVAIQQRKTLKTFHQKEYLEKQVMPPFSLV